ncbi:MAG: beta-ketoacyl-[acyl-carrier-protein] synthase family protein [Hoeflea sp.]|uniref:beta-ketoacyl-[acyl-carrier-protein] synthase family protein n=1 Tax=Hoeflea sp. TaxID=1940281 RepID=UPI001D7C9558|nr:beta-ketoacyl-[acyl-carrier-protein] synthase family protein [Hoeflea sp.]MBU4531817.1 beta-ketoacyl-[acyl-carrier-protein] synthase family protein [Alphaproteobacteria bacterium]MBU4544673.1 beta-ketoacyl-[acyl-carrier-protein] synthase family protein [Alphaproteobacteria bacterium]MBU4552904.1 beta-ketoacyl-[acyl-carrier-protein] synthase family protein [Alphaproteobacteria bacterium]MBV1725093.1 beta-ketoacyl-[acyl-carrier-protein] synthase family protein [Hoeflea sp.]MBV1761113.1 beta-k
MGHRRVVITGIGGICALGSNADTIWSSMKEGRDGCRPLSIITRDLKIGVGCGIVDYPEDDGIDKRQGLTMSGISRISVIAARQAMQQAGLEKGSFDPKRSGAVVGVGIFGTDAVDQSYVDVFVEHKKRTHIFTVPRVMPSGPSGHVSIAMGLEGPVFGVTSACASGNHAFISAVDQIRLGRADVMLAGGAELALVYGPLKAWESLRVLARSVCRPFSADRDGLVLGDGAAIAVLESYDHARARGANILAEIIGVGLSADASDIVNPTVEGPSAAMRNCLEDAGISAVQVDYINAHGTATQANDQTETRAIRQVFGSAADTVSVSSTKSMHGHCLGASSAIELIACVNAIREGVIPPTINYTTPDPLCDLDVTPNVAREKSVSIAISNAFAFGGTNAVIALGKV